MIIRLWIGSHAHGTYDVGCWEKIFDYWKSGQSPYDAQRRYTYSPVWFWVISSASWLNTFLHLSPQAAVKLPLILADVLTLLLLMRLAGPGHQEKALAGALFFWNPVSFLNTAYHGQFDNLATLFVLLACFFEISKEKKNSALSALSFFSAAAIKQFAFMLTPLFAFRHKGSWRAALYFILTPSLFMISLLPYFLRKDPHLFQSLFLDSLNLRVQAGVWGWSILAREIFLFAHWGDIQADAVYAYLRYFHYFLIPLLFFAAYHLTRRNGLVDAILVYWLLFYVFTVPMAPQYTVWIIPFAALKRDKYFYLYTVITTIHLVLFYIWHPYSLLWREYGLRHTGWWASYSAPLMNIFRFAGWMVTVAWLRFKVRELKFT